MRLPLNLLRGRLGGTWSLSEVSATLARSPLELEGVERFAPGMDRVITGRIVEAAAHPDADRLRVCSVDAGAAGALQIVTAATNVQAGDIVPVALDGAVLPTGKAIAASKMRGVMSQGMFCSLEELALGDGVEGVWVLPSETELGMPIAEAMDLGEVVLELAGPAHRGDLLSAHGVARELAALGVGQLVALPTPDGLPPGGPAAPQLTVAPEGVWRYAACAIEGVRVTPSLPETARILEAAGFRAVDAIVDVTNLMLLEFGQPMHAFDAQCLQGGRVEVRSGKDGETLALLDGRVVQLDGADLVVADADRPVALAGVMGGQATAVHAGTTALLLEVASFDPAAVRATARRHQVSSESAQRFSRGVDASAVPALLAEAVRRIVDVAGGTPGQVADLVPAPDAIVAPVVSFRPARTRALLGHDVQDQGQLAALARIGAWVDATGATWRVTPPDWRRLDLQREVDLVEEVAFQCGLDAVPAILPPMVRVAGAGKPDLAATLRDWATAAGLDEVVLPSLVPVHRDDVFVSWPAVAVAEGMGDFQVLRRSLWPGLLDVAARRRRDGADRAVFFEIGQVAWVEDGVIREEQRFAALIAGALETGPWLHVPQALQPDVRWGQGLLESLLSCLGVVGAAGWRAATLAGLQPGRTAVGGPSGACVAAEVHPELLERLDLAAWGRVVLVEARLPALAAETGPRHFRPFDRHPVARRDLAVVVAATVTAAEVEEVIRDAGRQAVRSLRCFDRYAGPGLPEGSVSLAMALDFGAEDRTLKDAEVEALEAALLAGLELRLGARRRS